MARKSNINREKVQAKADKLIARGKLLEGIAELNLLVEDNPADMNTVNKIGDLYVRAGKIPEAINEFTKIAESYCDDGFILKAIAIYKKINKLDPASLAIYQKLADLYLTQGLTMEAKSQYQVIGEQYLKEGKTRESLEVFGKVIELDPNNIKIRAKVADIYQKEGIAEKALHEYLVIGHKLVSKGMFKEAIAVFERARRIDEGNAHALKGMAVALNEEGRAEEAIPILRDLLKADPHNLEMLGLLGKSLMGTGHLPEAERVYVALYQEDTTAKEEILDLQRAYLRNNEYKSSFRCLQTVLPAIIEEGAVDAAVNMVREILKRNPKYVPALEALADIHRSRDEEMDLLAVQAALVDAYLTDGEKDKAVRLLQELVRADPMNAQYRSRLQELSKGVVLPPAAAPAARAAAPPPKPAAARPPAPRTAAPPPPTSAAPEIDMVEFEDDVEVDAPPARGARPTSPAAPAAPAPEEFTFEVTEVQAEEEPAPVDDLPAYEEVSPARGARPAPVEPEIVFDAGISIAEPDSSVPTDVAAELEMAAEEIPTFDVGVPDEIEVEPIEAAAEPVAELDAGEVAEMQMDAFEIEAPQSFGGYEVEEPARAKESMEEPLARDPDAEEREKFVAEHITEAEVFAKYGLTDRAIDQLKAVTARYPDDPQAHVKLKELYLDKEDARSAATEAILLHDIYGKHGQAVEAEVEIAEARKLAPDHPLLQGEPEAEVKPAPARARPSRTPVDVTPIKTAPPRTSPTPPAPVERPVAAPSAKIAEPTPRPASPTPVAPKATPPAPVAAPRPAPIATPRQQPAPPTVAAPRPAPARPVIEVKPQPAQPAPPAPKVAEPTPPPAAPPRPRPPRTPTPLMTKADDLLASLQASVKKPAPKGLDPLKAVDDLLAGLAAKPKPAKVAAKPPAAPPAPVKEERVAVAAASQEELADESLAEVFGDEQKFMDFASDLNTDLASLVADSAGLIDEAPESDAGILNDIFNEFKKGVDDQLDADDYETRYNLGIAYKEMGLVDEAIREFQVASADKGRTIECCSMLGLCFMEKGDADAAVRWFEKGLTGNGHTPEQLLGLHFDLAQALESLGDTARALEAYRKVHKQNPNHRNVGERIRKLEATV